MPNSRQQRYSSVVYERVLTMVDNPRAGKYKGLCRGAGSLVRTSGLMQTVAFLEARGQREERCLDLLRHLQEELVALNIVAPQPADPKWWLACHVRGLALPDYMTLTRNVLLLLNWHKRLCESLIQAPEDMGDEEDNQ